MKNIKLSQSEIQVIVTALDAWMNRGDQHMSDRTWLHRQDAAADLVHKLEGERDQSEQPKPERCDSRGEALCGNDPVEW
jgi:hypothetical protein